MTTNMHMLYIWYKTVLTGQQLQIWQWCKDLRLCLTNLTQNLKIAEDS